MIAIVDYEGGNLRSVAKAFKHLGIPHRITAEPADLTEASGLLIPGVGAFSQAMMNLNQSGLRDAIDSFVESGKPVLGICLGMQILAKQGFEPRETDGLGYIDAQVRRFEVDDLRVPHMGWNSVASVRASPLLEGIDDGTDFYFAHSYHMRCDDSSAIVATTDYGGPVTVVVQRENVFGAQFHPEKSQHAGLQVLQNFWGLVKRA